MCRVELGVSDLQMRQLIRTSFKNLPAAVLSAPTRVVHLLHLYVFLYISLHAGRALSRENQS